MLWRQMTSAQAGRKAEGRQGSEGRRDEHMLCADRVCGAEYAHAHGRLPLITHILQLILQLTAERPQEATPQAHVLANVQGMCNSTKHVA
jgi:hypothetical protein